MELSAELISEFSKAVVDTQPKSGAYEARGTVVIHNGQTCVRLDNMNDASSAIPITSSDANYIIKEGDRVVVQIKNHTLRVISNLSQNGKSLEEASIFAENVKLLLTNIASINAEYISAGLLDAKDAFIERLKAVEADITSLKVQDLNALSAYIKNLKIEDLEAAGITTERLEAIDAKIKNIQAQNAQFENVYSRYVVADDGRFNIIESQYAQLQAASIDVAKITKAEVQELFAKSGYIEEVESADGTFTRQLTAVEINADLIKTGTLAADRVVVVGEDGIIRKINDSCLESIDEENITEYLSPNDEGISEALKNSKLHGDAIIKKSVTADKVSVTDLHAFGATIGGFEITDKSIQTPGGDLQNGTPGIYISSDGEFRFGDDMNHIALLKDMSTGSEKYKLQLKISDSMPVGNRNYILKSNEPRTVYTNANQIYDLSKIEADGIDDYILSLKISGSGTAANIILMKEDTDLGSYGEVRDLNNEYLVDVENHKIYIGVPGAWNSMPTDNLQSGTVARILFRDEDLKFKDKLLIRFESDAPVNIEWSKLEKGTVPSDWTPAPEDMVNELDKMAKVFVADSTGASINNASFTKRVHISDDSVSIQTRESNVSKWNDKSQWITEADGDTTFKVGNMYVEVNKQARFGEYSWVPRGNTEDPGLMLMYVGG